jgi:hypothetical protein
MWHGSPSRERRKILYLGLMSTLFAHKITSLIFLTPIVTLHSLSPHTLTTLHLRVQRMEVVGGGGGGALDKNVAMDSNEHGVTSLHLFNMAIQDLQQLHDQIAKDRQRTAGQKLRDTSAEIFTLKKQLRKPGTPEAKQDIADRITHLQHELSSALEAKDLASTMRIRNFYKTVTGKMVPETFHCIRESNRSRVTHKLEHEGRTVTDPE